MEMRRETRREGNRSGETIREEIEEMKGVEKRKRKERTFRKEFSARGGGFFDFNLNPSGSNEITNTSGLRI